MSDLFGETCPCCGQAIQPQAQTRGPSFNTFWDAVPHKIGKAQAEKAWKKLKPEAREKAFGMIKTFYAKWTAANPQASPIHPATYLNNRRWEDYETQEVRDGDREALIAKMLQSPVPSVRAAAEKMQKDLEGR